MSKEAFYLHLCKKVHEVVQKTPIVASFLFPPGVTDDLERAVSGDVPPFWLEDEASGVVDNARLYNVWENRECTIPEHMQHIGRLSDRIAELEGRLRDGASIDWRAVMNQAMVDIDQDGSEGALKALPWVADWLLMAAQEREQND